MTPTLIQDNPLIDALGPYYSPKQLAEQLQYSPLDKVDTRSLNEEEQRLYLGQINSLFIPTLSSMKIADTIQQMLRDGYVPRNPRLVETKKRLYNLGECSGMKFGDLPTSDLTAAGFIVSGITGMGKTKEIKRSLSLFPQVIRHDRDEKSGWAFQKQLVWLYVEASHDGSRRGLLYNILRAIDEALETDYLLTLPKQYRTVDALAVGVGIVLATHYCGIIVLDEVQEQNFINSPFAKELRLFFLKLMNLGIPIVVSGNPFALNKLGEYSQLLRRFNSEGHLNMEPASDKSDLDWYEHLVPGLWDYNVMPDKTPLTDEIRHRLFAYTGGIRGLLRHLITGAQKTAILCGKNRVSVKHLDIYYNSSEMKEFHKLIKAFTTHNSVLLTVYKDIPDKYFDSIWKDNRLDDHNTNKDTSSQSSSSHSGASSLNSDKAKKTRTRYKYATTRKKYKTHIHTQKLDTLRSDDIRKDGLQELLVEGFESMHKE